MNTLTHDEGYLHELIDLPAFTAHVHVWNGQPADALHDAQRIDEMIHSYLQDILSLANRPRVLIRTQIHHSPWEVKRWRQEHWFIRAVGLVCVADTSKLLDIARDRVEGAVDDATRDAAFGFSSKLHLDIVGGTFGIDGGE